ncbi:MAG: methylmalonyl-CoA epimerase [Bdellovibrionia bacterium]
MITLNHIGIAVKDLPQMKKLFSILGLTVEHQQAVLEQGVMTHFLPLPETSTHLELLEPLDPQGTVARFIEKKGPGIHHLAFCFSAGELEPILNQLRAEGLRLIYEAPQPGAQGMRVNFIHPGDAGGILIELMEPG